MRTYGHKVNWATIASTVTVIMALARHAHAVKATGGDSTVVDGYVSHTFTSNGILNVTSEGMVEVLVVAGGGGGGGGAMSGGGGAGGVIYTAAYPVVAGQYAVSVGGGGLGGFAYNLTQQTGVPGENSSFGNDLVAVGGGGGSGWSGHPATSGGSGGGGNSVQAAAAGTDGQGHAGNIGSGTSGQRSGGGGGGADAIGGLGVAGAGGAGGDGIAVFGSYYGGGGGGGLEGTPLAADGGGPGGLGGGGAGSKGTTKAVDAEPNTGGGGGGAGYSGGGTGRIGGHGGSGIVIVRYYSGAPGIQNLAATNVTLTSAFLNGSLTTTGGAPTTVSVYWGDTDGGEPASGLWQATNTWVEGFWAAGETPTYQATSLGANAFYYYRYYATNSLGEDWASPSAHFLTDYVTVEATDATARYPGNNGEFTIRRSPALTNEALTVNYTMSGSAVSGVDYVPLSGSITLHAGVAQAAIPLLALRVWNPSSEAVLTLASGPYAIGATGNSATVAIQQALTIYVSTNGSHDVAHNFDTWAGAATNVQCAVSLANTLGVNVVVNDGVYSTTNTLALTNDYTLMSVNGPDVTTIGRDVTAPVFCVIDVSGGAMVSGFTIRDGRAWTTGWQAASHPTGVAVANGMVSNCVIRANVGGTGAKIGNGGWVTHSRIVSNTTYTAVSIAGGAVLQDSVMAYHSKVITVMGISGDGLVRRCRIHSNSANGYANIVSVGNTARLENSLIYANDAPGYTALAISGGVIDNCTVYGNSGTHASGGSGIVRTGGTIRNTIIFGNTSSVGAANPDYRGSVAGVYYSCSPDLTAGLQGNITDDPMLVDAGANDFRLLPGSPCRDAGMDLAAVTDDLAGMPRPQIGGTRGGLFHDMGAYEMEGAAGAFGIGFYGDVPLSGFAPLAVTFRANAVGSETNVTWYGWDFDNDGVYEKSGPGLATVTHSFSAGLYSIALLASNSVGEAAASTIFDYVSVVGTDLYVATNGLHQAPFDTWLKAATNVHDAIDIAIDGNTVHIGSGVFPTTKEITLMSGIRIEGNGPENTMLQRVAAAGNFRMLTVNHAAAFVTGLTVRNGYAGGGASVHGINLLGGSLSNVTLTSCSTVANAGRALAIANARAVDCVITNNGGTAVLLQANAVLENSLIQNNGGTGTTYTPVEMSGAGALMDRCRVIGNRSYNGYNIPTANLSAGTLRNTLFSRNYAPNHACVYVRGSAVVENCTVVGNNAASTAVAMGDGVHQTGGIIRNCIIYGNMGSVVGDYTTTGGTISHSLAPELTLGAPGSNRNDDPRFRNAAGGDYRLSLDSPCINAGTNQAWMWTATDLRGAKRISQSTVDMGAYETLPPASTLVILR